MNIAILGTGAYGLALSLMFHRNKCNIKMWTKFDEERDMLVEKREHTKVLPGVHIPSDIYFTTDMKEAVEGADLIVIAVPAGFVDSVSSELKYCIDDTQHICIASKGIEQGTCSFVYDILTRYIDSEKVAVISGPSFAVDIASLCPIGLALATTNDETDHLIKQTLQNDYLKLRSTHDIVGVELCGSIKNVIAIAAGILDGMGFPESTQAMFITESLHDIKSLINALGGDGNTILSFAGFGDLLLTATSTKSRNFRFGYMLGSKAPKADVDEYMNNTTIEGLYTLKSIYKLLRDREVDMPIIDLVYDIIYKDRDPKDLAKFLIEKD
mgnify:CR=1 FL=1